MQIQDQPPLKLEFPRKLGFLLKEPARLKILYGGRGGGKCLAIGTKVIMYDGTLRCVEDVKENDLLMGIDSTPRKVLGTTRGISQMYKIKQTSGIDYVVNSGHILSLKKRKASYSDFRFQKSGNPRNPGGRYPNYPEITNINVVEAAQKSKRWQDSFRGYRAGLIEFDKQDVAIDPWYLGAWLGDGGSWDTIIHSGDTEVLGACEQYADKLGMRIAIYEYNSSNCVGIAIRNEKLNVGTNNQLWTYFKLYNLFQNKHIPHEYISNSEEIRLALLAGLIDTDGTIHNNGYDISQVNERLAKDIKYLADTLGFRTNLSKQKTKCFYKGNQVIGETWRISINGDTWRVPCKIVKKQIKKEQVKKNKDFLLSQIEIEPVGKGEYAGFAIDGDHLFMLEDGTVTHNSINSVRAAIIFSRARKLEIVCFRELQKSIQESLHGVICNEIEALGITDEFEILNAEIINKITGARFTFEALRYNISKIKSRARIDIALLEEADNISKTSLDILMPTVRSREYSSGDFGGPFGKGPEIWILFNPKFDTDEVYKRFILKKEQYAPDYDKDGNRYAIVCKINHSDNKWFPADLRREMELLKLSSIEDYLHVWEGNTKQVLDGAIYAEEIKKVLLDGRRGKVQYDPSRPVHTFWDLGHDDYTSIWFVQQIGVEYNMISFFQDRLKKIAYYIEHLQGLKYNYGYHYLPHDADNETLASRSVARIVRDSYPGKVRIVPRVAQKVLGIRAGRQVFDLCNFDEENTADGWQCLCRYQYDVDETGKWSTNPRHDCYSHGADAYQTFALSLKPEQAAKKPRTVSSGKILTMNTSNNRWMGG